MSFPRDARVLVTHLDDVGMCLAANTAWESVFRAGTVSSASVMMPCPWAPEALIRAKGLEGCDLGVHLTLTCEWDVYRWGPYGPGTRELLTDSDGYLPRTEVEHERITASTEGRTAVAAEMEAQLQGALSAGVDITHLDSHMFSALYPPNLEIYMNLALKYRLPAMLPGNVEAWRPWCRSHEEAAALTEAVGPARKAGMPLFDRVVGVALDNPPPDRISAVQRLIRDCIPGLNFLFLHAADDQPELRMIAGDWKSRVGDLEVFSSPGILELIAEEGIQLVGMRALRDMMRG
jgi:predicted glycoside hydrolase/deacetylase ChbG (UPF0249 family)